MADSDVIDLTVLDTDSDSDVAAVLDTDSDSDVADIKVERASEIEYEVAGSDVTFSGSEVEDDEETAGEAKHLVYVYDFHLM